MTIFHEAATGCIMRKYIQKLYWIKSTKMYVADIKSDFIVYIRTFD